MKKEKAYCEYCDNDVDYVIEYSLRNATIKGKTFEYPFIVAKCKRCGSSVAPVSIGKLNSIALFDGYKKCVGLLTSKEIKEIRKELGLTQEELARIMGCGLRTITRYENGAIQDRVFDNFIRFIAAYNFKNRYYSNDENVDLMIKQSTKSNIVFEPAFKNLAYAK